MKNTDVVIASFLLFCICSSRLLSMEHNATIWRSRTESVEETCECGIKYQTQKIVGGEVTERNEYPWMASIHETKEYFLNGAFRSQFCGGTIISTKWVITAAHCVVNYRTKPYKLTVSVGRHNLNSIFGIFFIPRVASAINLHLDYNPRKQELDLALIKVLLPVTVSSRIAPICLPSVSDIDFTGKQLVVTGWGSTIEGGVAANRLRDVEVKGISNEECKRNYASTGIDITENMVCAGLLEGGKDACQGDSGGPLIYQCGHRFTLIGIVSFGIGCAQKEYPGVYTRISKTINWIEEVVGVGGYCPNSCSDGKPITKSFNDIPGKIGNSSLTV